MEIVIKITDLDSIDIDFKQLFILHYLAVSLYVYFGWCGKNLEFFKKKLRKICRVFETFWNIFTKLIEKVFPTSSKKNFQIKKLIRTLKLFPASPKTV